MPLIFSILLIPIHFGESNENYFHNGKVIETTEDGAWVSIEGDNYFIINDYDNELERNDHISFECDFILGEEDFLYYLRSHNSSYYCYANNIQVTQYGNGVNNKLKEVIDNSDTLAADFFDFLYFGNISEEGDELINSLGIYHIFIISGFHISLFIESINIFFKKVFKKEGKIVKALSIVFVLPFIIIVFPSIPAIRALSFHIMSYLNIFLLGKKYSNLDLISLQGIIFITINPYVLFNISFLLSFFITLFISIPKKSNPIKITLIAFIISIPLLSIFKDEINLLSPLLIILLTPLITPLLIAGSFLTFLPWCWFLLDWYIWIIWNILTIMNIFYISLSLNWIPIYFSQYYFFSIAIIIMFIEILKIYNINNGLFSKFKKGRDQKKIS